MKLLLIVLVLLATFFHTDAIKCYACGGSNEHGSCTDPFNPESSGNFLSPCGITSNACFKIKREINAVHNVVKRGCVNVIGEDFCSGKNDDGAKCTTCTTDRCNGAASVTLGVVFLLPLFVALRNIGH